jgi:hypothetical protein
MKDWLVSDSGNNSFWLTRIDVLPDGKEEYLCGCCDGPLENHVVGFFASTKGSPGCVACAICCKCSALIGDYEAPSKKLDDQIELLLDNTMNNA